VGPRAGLDRWGKSPTGIRSWTVQPVVTIQTELPGPLITLLQAIKSRSFYHFLTRINYSFKFFTTTIIKSH